MDPCNRSGFLHVTSDGKGKSWKQRWVELNLNTGQLDIRKFKSTASSENSSLSITKGDSALTIQGDASLNAPTPFCFTLTVCEETLWICTQSSNELQDWVDAISQFINQETGKTTGSGVLPSDITDQRAMDRSIPQTNEIDQDRGSLFAIKDGYIGNGLLLLLNPITLIFRFGDWQVFALTMTVTNLYFVWLLWFSHPDGGRAPRCESSINATKDPSRNPISLEGAAADESDDTSDNHVAQEQDLVGEIDGNKARAGDSLEKCISAPSDPVDGCWTTLDASRFKVRQGPKYKRTKLKRPSGPAILEIVATDTFLSERKVDNIGNIVELPNHSEYTKKDLFIVNFQVPNYAVSNPLWGEKQGDGPGFNLVMYFWIPPDVRKQLDGEEEISNPQIKLLREFMIEDSTIHDRFKAIGIVANAEEPELGRTERHLLDSYNGQPILTRPQHRFYHGDGYFEVDVDAHEFSYLARKGLSGVADHMCHMVVDCGLVLEGQADEELPEQILGCVRLCKLDLEHAPYLR